MENLSFQFQKFKMKKGYLDISFSWIFAIIVGAIILFGAVYGIVKFSQGIEHRTTTQGAKELTNFFNPLESGMESAKSSSIKFPVESRVYLSCESFTDLGAQGISLSEKIRKKWSEKSEEIKFRDNYVFSDSIEEGKNFYVFSKPFDFPFRVATFIYFSSSSKKYCFIDAPREIEREIQKMEQENLVLEDECVGDELKVCFRNSNNCDILVESNSVKKDGKILYYQGSALMYAAIFSDPEIYECNLQRVMGRINLLSKIYKEKDLLLEVNGCSTNMYQSLINLETLSNSYESSKDLSSFNSVIMDLESKNRYVECKLW